MWRVQEGLATHQEPRLIYLGVKTAENASLCVSTAGVVFGADFSIRSRGCICSRFSAARTQTKGAYPRRLFVSAIESKLHSDGIIDKSQVCRGQNSDSCAEANFAYSGYLIGHCLSLFTVETDESFARKDPFCAACNGDDLKSIQSAV
jgi:hypothetical protein